MNNKSKEEGNIYTNPEAESSVRKHQLSEVHLKLFERSRQLASWKDETFGDFLSRNRINAGLLLRLLRLFYDNGSSEPLFFLPLFHSQKR